MKIYPYPGAISIECSTGGHGRCFHVCDCWCHNQNVDTVADNYQRLLDKVIDCLLDAKPFEPRALLADFPMGADSDPNEVCLGGSWCGHKTYHEPRALSADFPDRGGNADEPGWDFCPKCGAKCGGYCNGN